MADASTAAAAHHLPWFITAPGETDTLFVAMIVFLIAVVLAVGNLYFQLHALPERMAHRANRVQLQVVAVLALLALFTHNHLFWIAALLLALIQLPDFSTPINSMAQSLEKLAAMSWLSSPEARRSEQRVLEGGQLLPLEPRPSANGDLKEGATIAGAAEQGPKPVVERT